VALLGSRIEVSFIVDVISGLVLKPIKCRAGISSVAHTYDSMIRGNQIDD
jgi:hypothetical protein